MIDFIQVNSTTMNVFFGHPLQPDLSDCTIKFIPYFRVFRSLNFEIPYLHYNSCLNRRGFLLQSAKARLQWIDSIQVCSTTMNVFIGHPLQPDLSDCKSLRFIPILPFSRFLYPMVFDCP